MEITFHQNHLIKFSVSYKIQNKNDKVVMFNVFQRKIKLVQPGKSSIDSLTFMPLRQCY